jgi:cell division septation protein DedD
LLPPPEKPMPRPAALPAAPPPDAPRSPSGPTSGAAASAPSSQPQQAVGKPPVKPASVTSPTAKPETAQKNDGMRIQLGSVRSEEAAHQEWDRIRRANPDLLASITATPVRADLGDKGVFYRLLTGPIADADRICGELKRRNIGCIIAR